MQSSACFHSARPTLPISSTQPYPILYSHKAPFIYLCLLLYGAYRHVCVTPLVCTHPLRGKKNVHCKLVKRRKGPPLFSLWPVLYGERILTLDAPEGNGFLCITFCNGWISQMHLNCHRPRIWHFFSSTACTRQYVWGNCYLINSSSCSYKAR